MMVRSSMRGSEAGRDRTESLGPIVWRGFDARGPEHPQAEGHRGVKPPQSQFTILQLMGLVALCALGLRVADDLACLSGRGAARRRPGLRPRSGRGGTGILGGIVSGCLIPMGLAAVWAAIEYVFANRPIRETLDFFPALFLLFVVCLVWSSVASFVLFLVDWRSPGWPRSNRHPTGAIDAGIRFLPDEDGPGNGPRTRYVPVSRVPASRRGPDR